MPTNCSSSTGIARTAHAISQRPAEHACFWTAATARATPSARPSAKRNGDVLVFIDADGSHDPADIPALVRPILDGEADHVSGSRMLGGSDELHATIQQFVRLFGSQIITLSINYTLNVRLTDCQNGFRAIRKEVAADLGLDEDITTIEQEMIIKSIRRGYRMAEVATHEYVRANGESNFRVKDVWSRYLFSLIYYLLLWNPPSGARP